MNTIAEAIDIHDPIHEICARLGIEPTNTLHLDFTPYEVVATVASTNDAGKKFVEELTGEVATEKFTFKVTT